MQASGPAVKAKKVVPQGSHPEADRIDKDGLPVVGTVLYPSQSFYNTQDDDTGAAKPWLVPACQDVHMACDRWCLWLTHQAPCGICCAVWERCQPSSTHAGLSAGSTLQHRLAIVGACSSTKAGTFAMAAGCS